MCMIYIDIKTLNDLYFAITNTILSLDFNVFTANDIIKKLKDNNISDESIKIGNEPISKKDLKKYVEDCLDNLVEHGKVIEEPRSYQLAK